MRSVDGFLYRHFDDVKHYNGADLRVNCPFCVDRYGSEDTQYKLYVSDVKETCHCFRCDYAATWTRLVMDVTGCDYIRAVGELYIVPKPLLYSIPSKLANLASKEFTPAQGVSGQASDIEALQPVSRLPVGATALHGNKLAKLHIAKKYMKKRGFGPKYWKRYNIGYMDGRIIIPIEGDYWQGRAIFARTVPRFMSPAIPSVALLFNYHVLAKYPEIVVTEGAFSAMAVGDNAVGLVGKNPTREKIERLKQSHAKKFIITLERNAYSMLKLADELVAYGRDVEVWEYDGDDDPADWGVPTRSVYDFKKKVVFLLDV